MRAPDGWASAHYGDILVETHDKRGTNATLPVLSVTKTRGPMLASERFGKALHGKNLDKYRVARRDTIVADPMLLWDGSIGRQGVVDSGIVSPDYRVYDVQAELADVEFVSYLVRSPTMRRFYQGGARGTNVRRNRIARSDFLRIPVALPPLPEQRKIAAILTAVDETIEKSEAVIEQLGVVKKAMMQELLTRGLPGRHTRFKKTEIGEVPAEWEVAALGDVLDGIDAGWSPQCDPSVADDNEWGVLKVSSVTWGEFRPEENKRLPASLTPRPELQVRTGDVLLSRANTPNLVGRAVVVRATRPRLMMSDKLLRLRVNQRATGEFVNAVLGTDSCRAMIQDAATGTSTSMKNISQAKLRGLPIPLPGRDEQELITGLLLAMGTRQASELETASGLGACKSALMSVLLTGELRVPVEALEFAP